MLSIDDIDLFYPLNTPTQFLLLVCNKISNCPNINIAFGDVAQSLLRWSVLRIQLMVYQVDLSEFNLGDEHNFAYNFPIADNKIAYRNQCGVVEQLRALKYLIGEPPRL